MRSIKRITRMDCAPFVMSIHYAGRWPSITYAYGLFEDDMLEGIVTYGTPASATLRSGVAGPDFSTNVVELNRLCLRNNRKNDASWLVAHSLRLLGQQGDFIVVSFADTEQGHSGVVYQAAGFTYHGLSAKRTDWKIKGQEHLHGQTIADRYRGVANRAAAIRADYGDDFYLSPRPRKHRYIKTVGRKGFCVKARRAYRYPQEPYPRKVTA